ncbi:MAG: sigma-54-dependent Fis family transcriptional regulator [Parvularculaceae bacterium]|nr:sigma-54-dependent Fis family transcriptional regulator [Parvularculaceae bacterium]
MPKTIFLVDDDPTQRRLMQAVCERAGYFVKQAGGGEEALDMLRSDKGASIDLMMLDLVMPNVDGMEVLAELKTLKPELPVIMLTAQGGVETVVKAMQAGAVDFFVKPASPERVTVGIANALNVKNLRTEVSRLKRKDKGEMTFTDVVGTSPAFRQCLKLAERAAASTIPILITGESGVGKEMIARAIQGSSDRTSAPFVTVNCGAIPENLVESILFGHEKGAFTGATGKHIGKFQEADGGTLFLDEVGELPLETQVKLLRALQEGEVDPVGSKRPVKVDVRVISATNRDLSEAVQDGTFREDLFYRLNVFPVEVPPLRQRREDIPDLINHFISRYNAEEGRDVRGVRNEVMDVLVAQDWPGNVRQLENTIYRAVVLCEDAWLSASDFPTMASAFEDAGVFAGPPTVGADQGSVTIEGPTEVLSSASVASATIGSSTSSEGIEVYDNHGHLRSLQQIERDLIAAAIEMYRGQMSEVARRLGIGRSTLYRKVQEQGIEIKRTG